jgi:hypothetical protein
VLLGFRLLSRLPWSSPVQRPNRDSVVIDILVNFVVDVRTLNFPYRITASAGQVGKIDVQLVR